MSKTELIAEVATRTGLSKKDAESAVSATLDVISDTLADGGKVQLVGFGTFETRERSARSGHNPTTGEVIEIPSSTVPAFKAGKALKDRVAK